MSASPRIVVILDRAVSGAEVLSDVKAFTGRGLAEIRSRIVAGLPVVIEEMFSNAWYDERAEALLALLTHWQSQGIGFEIREIASLDDGADAALISLGVLRNIIEPDDLGRAEADHRTGLGACRPDRVLRGDRTPRASWIE